MRKEYEKPKVEIINYEPVESLANIPGADGTVISGYDDWEN